MDQNHCQGRWWNQTRHWMMDQAHDFTFGELADWVVVDFNKKRSCGKTRRLTNLLGSAFKAQSSPADELRALPCFAEVALGEMKAFRKSALEVAPQGWDWVCCRMDATEHGSPTKAEVHVLCQHHKELKGVKPLKHPTEMLRDCLRDQCHEKAHFLDDSPANRFGALQAMQHERTIKMQHKELQHQCSQALKNHKSPWQVRRQDLWM